MENQPEDCQDWLESCINEDKSGPRGDNPLDLNQLDFDNDGIDYNKSPEERKGTYTRLRSASKPHSTPQTLNCYICPTFKNQLRQRYVICAQRYSTHRTTGCVESQQRQIRHLMSCAWLDDNYEIAEGVCIPRSTLYVHYLDYCEKNDTQPVNAASFGKIIRQQFPQLTTRRLGTRGQSKGVDGRKENVKQIIAYSPRSKLGTLLPDFPDVKEIQLPPNVEEGKVFTFLMMYRTHCQRILDTVIRANFDEVQSFLLHFWQGMPSHIKSILESKVLVTLVGVCDSILYKAIANVLMPTVLQPLPESLTQVIRKFSVQLDDWLKQALDTLPEGLQTVKFDLARCFSQVLKRQTSLNHLCQAARTVIHSAEITSQMLDDWINVDLNSIIKQTLYTMDNYADTNYNAIFKLTHDFELLLDEQSPLESYIDWLDKMVDQCVVQKSQREPGNMKRIARQFLLMWSCFGTRVIRDMTLHSAPSFGSYHLLHLMFDEYVLYTVEHLYNQDKGHQLYRAAKGEISLDIVDELLRADPHPGRSRYSGSPHEDRTSVIRGPDCTLPHSSNTKPLSHFDGNFQIPSSYPSLQTMSTYEDNKQNRGPQSNNFMPWNESNPSSSKTTFSSPATYPTSMTSACVPETFTGCSNPADNNYDWYDWTEGMCNNNVTSALVPNFGLMSRNQNADQRSRNISTNNNFYSQSDLNDLNMNFDQQFRRKYVDLPPLKRKHGDDLQDGVLRPQTSEYYQHNITNLI